MAVRRRWIPSWSCNCRRTLLGCNNWRSHPNSRQGSCKEETQHIILETPFFIVMIYSVNGACQSAGIALVMLSWYSCHVVKSLQLNWRSGTRRFHLRVPDLQMSCSDLTKRWGTRRVAPVMDSSMPHLEAKALRSISLWTSLMMCELLK